MHKYICNVVVAYLLKDKKGSRTFYDILAHVDEICVKNRRGNQFGNISDKEWKVYNTSIKDTKEVKLADLQYKINNEILVTNCFYPKSIRLIIMDVLTVTNTEK